MLADSGDDRTGSDPFVGGCFGVVVVDGAAGGIPSVEGVLRRAVATFCHRLIELAVIQAGEGALLINYARNGVGKRGVLHPVEHHGAHRHLAGVALTAGFCGD